MKDENKNSQFSDSGSDNLNVLNFLLANVRGISPSSLAPAYLANESDSVEEAMS